MTLLDIRRAFVAIASVALLSTAASSARADPYIARMDLYTSLAGGISFPIYGARPVAATAPGGNAVGAPLAMGAGDVFVEDRFFTVYSGTPCPYDSWSTHAAWGNGAGTLSTGAGPGTTTFCGGGCIGTPTENAGAKPGWARVSVPEGRIRFGGIQAALGRLEISEFFCPTPSVLVVRSAYDLNPVGGPVGGSAVSHTPARLYPGGWTSPGTITVTGMPWTTGKVIVDNPASSYGVGPLSMTGYDTTVSGFRGIQLVSGVLTHFSLMGGAISGDRIGYMTLNLRFVPEPRATALLGTGFTLLPLIGMAQRRRRSRRIAARRRSLGDAL